MSQSALVFPDNPPVWEQQPDETPLQYHYFREFLEMGETSAERSIKDLALRHGISPQAMYNHSHKQNWTERAVAYDRWVETTKHQELNARRTEVDRRTYLAALELHELTLRQWNEAQRSAKIQAEAIAFSAAQQDGVTNYRVTVELDTRGLLMMAQTLQALHRELRIAAQMPTNISAQKIEQTHTHEHRFEDFIKRRQQELDRSND